MNKSATACPNKHGPCITSRAGRENIALAVMERIAMDNKALFVKFPELAPAEKGDQENVGRNQDDVAISTFAPDTNVRKSIPSNHIIDLFGLALNLHGSPT